ncbi:MAG: efflux RND transporter periplasmic adaptor subunit [SAR324 cluster bacterium]|nr:efflux RND transporter periplasmic adaptor subunit [SAR324 cluster bacterium]
MSWIKQVFKFGLPILILGGSVWGASIIMEKRPEPVKQKAPVAVLTVDAVRLTPETYQVKALSYGTVSPRTESSLIPQVSGEIVNVSPRFQPGGFFEKGDVLLQLDSRDYEASVKIAESVLVQARLAFEDENAKAEQALRDWKRLGQSGKPSDRVLRKPQVEAARAEMISAATRLEQAKRNLARTRIKAPYSGRILTKRVDIGQFVSQGTVLAEIFAVDYVEIRLPLSNDQLEFIDIPEDYRDKAVNVPGPKVDITATIGRKRFRWQGNIIRAEGALDVNTRQLFVVAQVDNPYGKSADNKPPLKIGQFVEAIISGQVMENVFVIPRSALDQNNDVMLIENNSLVRRSLSLLWSDGENAVIGGELHEGELLCVTPPGSLISGMRVNPVVQGEPAVPNSVSQKEDTGSTAPFSNGRMQKKRIQ